jgi:putative DNA primase/helicase
LRSRPLGTQPEFLSGKDRDLQAGDDPQQPQALDVRVDGIPPELRQERRFLCWRHEWEQRRKRWAKVPYQANGKRASSTDPTTWTDFPTALSAYLASRTRPGIPFSGIGFALGEGWAGVDLDRCRDPHTGTLEPWAIAIIGEVDSYTEISPSGTGVKIFVRGQLPEGRRKSPDRRVEMSDEARYFALTGTHLEGTPRTIEQRTPELATVHGKYVANRDDHAVARQAARAYSDAGGVGRPLDDDEVLLAYARRAKNGARFARLFAGQWIGLYPSQSEADLRWFGSSTSGPAATLPGLIASSVAADCSGPTGTSCTGVPRTARGRSRRSSPPRGRSIQERYAQR